MPVDPVAAPLVPPLISAAGGVCVVSFPLRGRRVRPVRAAPLAELLPDAPLPIAPPDMPLLAPPLMLPDPLPDAPAPMLPAVPPLIELPDVLSLMLRDARWPGRTDELLLRVDTLAVSPFELATVVWATRVTWRCVTVRARWCVAGFAMPVLSCIAGCADADGCAEPADVLPLLLPVVAPVEGCSEGGVFGALPAVLLPDPVTGGCGVVVCADAANGRIAIVASVVMSLVISSPQGEHVGRIAAQRESTAMRVAFQADPALQEL